MDTPAPMHHKGRTYVDKMRITEDNTHTTHITKEWNDVKEENEKLLHNSGLGNEALPDDDAVFYTHGIKAFVISTKSKLKSQTSDPSGLISLNLSIFNRNTYRNLTKARS